MQGVCLRFYVLEFQKHHGILIHEWLYKKARELGIKGGAVFRAISGFGRHGLKEEHFFELGSELPLEILFYLTKEEAQKFLENVKLEKLNLFYSKIEAEFDFSES